VAAGGSAVTSWLKFATVADRDDYSRMMGVGPACFDRVVENIRRLVAMKKDHPQTTTIAHRRWMKARSGSRTMAALHGEPCLLPWYSMIIRADGSVPTCCALQHSSVATVEERDLTSIWHGARMTTLRRQLRAAALGHQYERVADHPADQICAVGTGTGFQCPFKATFYRHDLPFSRRLAGVVEDTRAHAVALRSDASVVGRKSENHANDGVPGLT